MIASCPKDFMTGVRKRNPGQEDFHQAVEEVVDSIWDWYAENSQYHSAQILERITEPDRIISFRVCWETDEGEIRANRGWRVQFNHSIGPYKGGIRFHPSVDEGVLKFLAFEQIFKNSLTGLPLGGGKGGSNFNPKGKSDREIMRFCQSFMTELRRYIGDKIDVPAGDIGVGTREISYMFGHYLRLRNEWAGVLTGKGSLYGGSLLRKEATGFGCLMICKFALEHHSKKIGGMNAVISGSGNVALYAAKKALSFGVNVKAMSDSKGYITFKDGLTDALLEKLIELKEVKRGRISDLTEEAGVEFVAGGNIWEVECEMALPCATQNEMSEDDAKLLIKNGCKIICEGANMPLTAEANHVVSKEKILYVPGKAANAGGVSVSGLEMTQNITRLVWTEEEVEKKLQEIIKRIHDKCVEYGTEGGHTNYQRGANIAGFKKVADAMLAYGIH